MPIAPGKREGNCLSSRDFALWCRGRLTGGWPLFIAAASYSSRPHLTRLERLFRPDMMSSQLRVQCCSRHTRKAKREFSTTNNRAQGFFLTAAGVTYFHEFG